MKKRHEILINRDLVQSFNLFYLDYFGLDDLISNKLCDLSFTENQTLFILNVDDEFMILAKLKFNLLELNPWGTSINFN